MRMKLKNRPIIIVVCLFFMLLPAIKGNAGTPGNDPGGYEIRIKITGLRDSLVHLANYYGDKQYLKDSAKVDAAGNVLFKGAEPLPGGIYLFVFPNKTYFELLVDKEQKFSMECTMGQVIETMKVKGSTDNQLFYDYLKFIQECSQEVEPLKAQRKAKEDAKESTEELQPLAVAKLLKALDRKSVV